MEVDNWIDLLLLTVLLLSSVFGVMRGVIRGVFGIVSIVLAFYVAKLYGDVAAQQTAALLGESAFGEVLGYVLVFVVSLLVFSMLTNILRKAAEKADLGLMDRIGGLTFGALRGAVLGAMLVAMLASFPLHSSTAWQNSVMLPAYGGAIKTVLVYAGGEEYWEFDDRNRPRLVLISALGAANDGAGESEDAEGQIDSTLDQLKELSGQPLEETGQATTESLD